MSIFVEVISDCLEVSYSDYPCQRYLSNMSAIICEAASEPYRRGTARRWFAYSNRVPRAEVNGRPC